MVLRGSGRYRGDHQTQQSGQVVKANLALSDDLVGLPGQAPAVLIINVLEGQHDDRNRTLPWLGPQNLEEGEAVHLPHHQINLAEAGPLGRNGYEPDFAALAMTSWMRTTVCVSASTRHPIGHSCS